MEVKMKTTNKLNPKQILLFLISIILFTSFAIAQNSNQTTSPSNIKIFIEYELAKDNLLTNENIKVEVSGDKIMLSGTVPSLYDRKEAEEVAQSVDENYLVENNLKVESPNIPDSVLTNTIMDKIQSNLFYTIFDWLTVNSNNGNVTLKGWVHLPWLKKQFQTEVEKIPGVKSINNEMQNTFGPGEIGYRAARLIYNDPMFYGRQYLANPPVHIIVNNGTVILEGHVGSEALSSWVANTIRYRTDAFTVENNLQVKG
jgi:osmotically-inducible protein OsmY